MYIHISDFYISRIFTSLNEEERSFYIFPLSVWILDNVISSMLYIQYYVGSRMYQNIIVAPVWEYLQSVLLYWKDTWSVARMYYIWYLSAKYQEKETIVFDKFYCLSVRIVTEIKEENGQQRGASLFLFLYLI